MTKRDIITILKKYQKSPAGQRQEFLRTFEEKMIYRTTKTENPETTQRMVREILNRLATRYER